MNTHSSPDLGENLIFIISQPRSGSTLLQRVLSSHSLIHSVPEPRLLVKPLYGLRHDECACNYNAQLSAGGLKVFLGTLDLGTDAYLEGVRRMYSYLYEQALVGTGKTFFLDKTPRNYLVLDEIIKIFPNAKYVFLLRNPLSVLASIVNTFLKQDWLGLQYHKGDLLAEPPIMLQAIQTLGERCVVVHYESLVREPKAETQRLCDWLHIPFDPVMIEYGRTKSKVWHEHKHNVNDHSRPHADSLDAWRNSMSDPQIWRAMNDYLQALGPATISAMGYSYDELSAALAASKPNAARLAFTYSLNWLLDKPREQRPPWERWGVRTLTSLRTRGPVRTLALGAYRTWSSFSKAATSTAERSPII